MKIKVVLRSPLYFRMCLVSHSTVSCLCAVQKPNWGPSAGGTSAGSLRCYLGSACRPLQSIQDLWTHHLGSILTGFGFPSLLAVVPYHRGGWESGRMVRMARIEIHVYHAWCLPIDCLHRPRCVKGREINYDASMISKGPVQTSGDCPGRSPGPSKHKSE